MRVVESLHDPEPTPVIPADRDRVNDMWFSCEKLYLKFRWDLCEFQGLGRRERILDLIKGPYRILGILRGCCAPIVQGGKLLWREPAYLVVMRRPTDGTMDKIVIFRQIPATMIVAAGRIKYPALAVVFDPTPRFIASLLQDDPILAVALVLIGLVPALESFPSLHHRMVLIHNTGPENSFAVGLELSPKKVDILREV
tara:strand:+ start:152 stop:745 length:594 start_codon:yes stop_codon:yes gene_type:complete